MKPLNDDNKNFLLNNSAFVLPNNPTQQGWSANQIKEKLYKSSLILFGWLKTHVDEAISSEDTINKAIEDINKRFKQYVDDIANGVVIVNKALNDKLGNDITLIYETKVDALKKLEQATKALNDLITSLDNGTKIVARANADEKGKNIRSTYGSSLASTTQITTIQAILTTKLVNELGGLISSVTHSIDSASTTSAGLMSANDKARLDATTSDINTALKNAKDYADSLVQRSNLLNILGEASQSLNGLMSATDKARLDTLYALLGESEDSNNVVNTINEVLKIFESYPEGVNLANALKQKVNVSDIVDNLLSNEIAKPLSANQGRILKNLVDTKANDSDVYKKSEVYTKEETYNKSEVYTKVETLSKEQIENQFLGLGLIEVSPFDIETGTITIIYDNAILEPSYNEDTGILNLRRI